MQLNALCNAIHADVDDVLHFFSRISFTREIIEVRENFLTYEARVQSDPIQMSTLKPFYMSKHVVTQGVWKRIMESAPWKDDRNVKGGDDYPAVSVNMADAKEFCSKTGLRLPSESEWEYACRAGTTSKYYWGEIMDGNYAWYDENSWDNQVHEVGKKNPNAFGLHDMSGNVWEWCEGTL